MMKATPIRIRKSGREKSELGLSLSARVRGKTEDTVSVDLYMASDKVKFIHNGTHPFLIG